MDISLDYYKVFYYVARYGGISKAADALRQAQPNVSKTIMNLESQLGCKLLVRSNRGVYLTHEGEKLYRHLEVAIGHIVAAESQIISNGGIEGGIISIATTEMAFYGILIDAISSFGHDYPGVKIKVSNLNNTDALSMLKNGLADFAVLTSEENIISSFRSVRLKEFKEMLCADKEYVTKDKFNIANMDNYKYITLNRSTSSYDIYQNYLLSMGISREPDIEVATAGQVLSLIRSGVGIGFIAEPMIGDLAKSGEIEILETLPKLRSISLIEDKERGLNIVSRKFVEYLK